MPPYAYGLPILLSNRILSRQPLLLYGSSVTGAAFVVVVDWRRLLLAQYSFLLQFSRWHFSSVFFFVDDGGPARERPREREGESKNTQNNSLIFVWFILL